MNKRHSRFLLDFFACFLIPAYTLLFAGGVQWFGTNFSVIAVTGPDHYRGFVYWGILAGGYFFVMLSKLAFSLPRRRERWLDMAMDYLRLPARHDSTTREMPVARST